MLNIIRSVSKCGDEIRSSTYSPPPITTYIFSFSRQRDCVQRTQNITQSQHRTLAKSPQVPRNFTPILSPPRAPFTTGPSPDTTARDFFFFSEPLPHTLVQHVGLQAFDDASKLRLELASRRATQ